MAAEITANKMTILNTEEGKVTVFEDGVRIVDEGTKISAGRVEFYDRQNLAVIHGGGLGITTPTANVTADSARLLLGARKTYLYGNVIIRQQALEISSPAIIMDNAANQVQADSHVRIVDAERGIEASGSSGNFNLGSEDGVLLGSPCLVLRRSQEMTVTSDEMYLRGSERLARAIGHVRATTGEALLTCDTMTYFTDQDSAWAKGAPVLTQKENQVTGERMSFRFQGGELERIQVLGSERNPPKLSQKEDEMFGSEITLRFGKGKLSEIAIHGDSAHQPEMHRKADQAKGDSIAFQFQDDEIQSVRLQGRTSGRYFTDDGDRIEVTGTESLIRFKGGNAVQMEIANVPMGKLFRLGSEKPKVESQKSEVRNRQPKVKSQKSKAGGEK
jgi:lipopolysaccharide export system protein LptA